MRYPVAAKRELRTAAAATGMHGSPVLVGFSALGTMYAAITADA